MDVKSDNHIIEVIAKVIYKKGSVMDMMTYTEGDYTYVVPWDRLPERSHAREKAMRIACSVYTELLKERNSKITSTEEVIDVNVFHTIPYSSLRQIAEALRNAIGCMERQMNSDDVCDAPYNEDMELAIRECDAVLARLWD